MAETALPRALFHRLPLDLVGRVALRLLAGVVIGMVSSLLGVAGGDYHPHLSPRLRVGRQVGGDRRSRQIRWPQVWNADRVRAVLPPVKASVKGGRTRAIGGASSAFSGSRGPARHHQRPVEDWGL